jgi:hypothetical protein
LKKVFFIFLLVFSLQPLPATAAVMKSSKPIIELPYLKADEISDISLTPVGIVLTGTTESTSSTWLNGSLGGLSDGFIANYSSLGAPLWNLRLGSIANEIATSTAIDTDGSIWVVGAGTAITTPTPLASQSKALNPDNVVLDPLQSANTPLNRIKLWQVNSTGNLLNTFEFISESIIHPKKILISGTNLIILGDSYENSAVSGFYISATKTGVFSPIVKYGIKSTQINSALSNSDGSITAVGSSGELLLKVKPLSKADAITLKISASGVLQQVARATLKSTTRTWSSIDAGLLQGGKVSYSNKTEAAITKFSALSKPTWNVRYLSKSSALIASGKNSWATFVSSGVIKGIPSWKPKNATPVILELGKKGEVISSYTLPAPAVAIAANNEIGTVVITDSGVSFGLVVIN